MGRHSSASFFKLLLIAFLAESCAGSLYEGRLGGSTTMTAVSVMRLRNVAPGSNLNRRFLPIDMPFFITRSGRFLNCCKIHCLLCSENLTPLEYGSQTGCVTLTLSPLKRKFNLLTPRLLYIVTKPMPLRLKLFDAIYYLITIFRLE